MRAYRDDQKFLSFRINLLTWAVVVVFFFLAGAFWYVQAVQADKYRDLAESNALRELPVRAKRGLIMDRNGKILVDDQPAYQLVLMRSDLRQLVKTDKSHRQRMISFVAHTLGVNEQEVEARIDKGKENPFNQPLPLSDDLTMSQVSEVEAHRLTFPAISVEPVQRRNYRYGTMAAHVLGYMGEATEKDMKANAGLKLGDLIGKKGVEFVYDDYLRGRDGARYMVVDSHGRTINEYRSAHKEPVAGKNVYLTLDFDLQRKAEQYFIDNELVGAAVAMDPQTGDILAMVSSPAYNPNVFSRRFTPDTWKIITSNPFHLLQNRAIQGLYSPGSVFKVVMSMAGLANGAITPSTEFDCGGSAVFFGRRFRCWKREGHGGVTLPRGIKVSCDVFFYNVGARLGVDKIAEYARLLNFGDTTKIDLEGEKPGLVPSTEWANKVQHRKWYPSETISVAIGQGPLVVTVLQVATMMASIANGGHVLRPHVLRAVEEMAPNGQKTFRRVEPQVLHEVKLPPNALTAVRDGLWKVVNEDGGTGGNARVAGLDIAGKTGTVQVIAQHGWVKTESLPFKYADHAWFASYAPGPHPQMVVVVFVEHGGHGGTDAAPLAKALYEMKFKTQVQGTSFTLTDPATLQKLKEGELPKPGERAPVAQDENQGH